MSVGSVKKLYTTEDLLAMPDDGVERWLIKGELREKPSEFPGATMTVRNRFHCRVMVNISTVLKLWNRAQPKPRGEVLCGEAGIRLPGSLDDSMGVDVAYISPEVVVQQSDKSTLVIGVPTLCVEIISPNDTILQINEKIETYLNAGVAVVWSVDPYDQTVTVYANGQKPTMFNIDQKIPEHPAMPGFSPTVAELFE